MADKQTDRQKDGRTDGRRTIRIYRDFVQGQENPVECQRLTVHDEACRVVDIAFLSLIRGWISPSLYKVVVDYFLLPFLILVTKPLLLLSKTTTKRFLVRKRRQLGLIMTPRHNMIYDFTRRSLKRGYWGR